MVDVAGCEERAVRRERERRHGFRLAVDRSHPVERSDESRPVGDVPELHVSAASANRQQARATPGERADVPTGRHAERAEWCGVRGRVDADPRSRDPVGEAPSARRHGERRSDRLLVGPDRELRSRGRPEREPEAARRAEVPDEDRAVEAARVERRSVGAEGESEHAGGVAVEPVDDCSRGDVPDEHRPVLGADRELTAVSRERDRFNQCSAAAVKHPLLAGAEVDEPDGAARACDRERSTIRAEGRGAVGDDRAGKRHVPYRVERSCVEHERLRRPDRDEPSVRRQPEVIGSAHSERMSGERSTARREVPLVEERGTVGSVLAGSCSR